MESAEAAAAPFLGGWASIRAYFTPATLFLVVNLVIGSIALTSRATQHRRRRDHHHHYHDDGHGHYHLQEQHPHHQQPAAYGDHYYQPPPPYATPPAPPAPLARTSSVLDRLRSFDFGLYRFRSGDFPPEYGAAAAVPSHAHDAFAPVEQETAAAAQEHYARSRSEPAPAREERRPPPASRARKPGSVARKAQAAPAPPARVVEAAAEDDAVDARAEEFAGSFGRERKPSPLQEEYHYQEEYVPPVRPRAPAAAPLARTSSIMDRLRSLGGYLAPEQPSAASIPATDSFAAAEKKRAQAHGQYDRSRSEPAWVQGSNKKEKKQEAKPRMAKSSSEAKTTAAPSRAEAALAGESVDARAEAFIDSFKQQQARHHRREEEYVPPPAPAPLSRAPSMLERIRSFGLSRFRSGDLGPDLPAAAATPAAEEKRPATAAQFGRSRSEPAREQGKKEPRMRKSSSSVVEGEEDKEEPAAGEADHGVDARADDFINKFRQQLQLQRLNSLLNYKEMLGGGKQ